MLGVLPYVNKNYTTEPAWCQHTQRFRPMIGWSRSKHIQLKPSDIWHRCQKCYVGEKGVPLTNGVEKTGFHIQKTETGALSYPLQKLIQNGSKIWNFEIARGKHDNTDIHKSSE
jgi:hypothetical protein